MPTLVYGSGYGADCCFAAISGTGIRVQGKVQGNESAILFSLDNNTIPAPLEPGPDGMVYSSSGLESRDHQLLMSRLPTSNATTNFYLYSITLVFALFHAVYDSVATLDWNGTAWVGNPARHSLILTTWAQQRRKYRQMQC